MKIARIIYDWPPPWQGLAPAPYELTASQERLGHKIDVFCGRWPNAGEIATIDNVNLYPVWRAPAKGTISLTSSVLIFLRYLKWRKNNKPDIIHIHGHFGLWIYVYRTILQKFFPWAQELRSPVVAHFHNTVAGRREKLEKKGDVISNISKLLDWPLAELSDRLAVDHASACIFVSNDLKDEAIKHYKADEKKCYVVESGVSHYDFIKVGPEEKIKSRLELGIEPTDKVLLYVGALVERKNPHLILEALLQLPKNYKLLLVGTGEGEYMNTINKIIVDNKISDRVIQIGYTPYPQIPIAYQVSDLFILPSTFEGFPKVAVEALACGVPALVSGFKIGKEVEGVEYLNELSVAELLVKIKQMLNNPPNVDVFHIGRYFSWDTKATEVDKIYEKVKSTYLR